MTAEQREVDERHFNGDLSAVKNKLQQYLRDNFSVDSLYDGRSCEQAERLLEQVVRNYCMRHNQEMSENSYNGLVRDAIKTYISNWQNKKPGEDNRSHALGKVHKTTSTTLDI